VGRFVTARGLAALSRHGLPSRLPSRGSSVLRPPPPTATVTVPARTQHLRGWILVALGVFQLWLWGTRIANLLAEVGSFSAAFVAVHLVLYVSAIGAGLLLVGLGWRLVREASSR